MIIGISGKIKHGKDTAALMLQELFQQRGISLQKKQFAGKLKQFVATLIGCTIEQLDEQEFKASILSPEWRAVTEEVTGYHYHAPIKELVLKEMTVRDLLISVGHGLRVSTHSDVWVNGLFIDYKPIFTGGYPEYGTTEDGKMIPVGYNSFYKDPDWIIPDMRYPNEANRIKKLNGYTIRINRPGAPVLDHPSETLLDAYNFDFVIENDGSLDDLRTKLSEVVDKIYPPSY